MQNLLRKSANSPQEHLQETHPEDEPFVNHDLISTKYVRHSRAESPRPRVAPRIAPQPHVRSTSPTQRSFSHAYLQKYIKWLPLLFVAIFLYSVIFFIFQTVPPQTLQSSLLPNSFFSLLFLIALAHFFFFSFLFLNSGRGFRASLLLTVLFFLLLHHVLTEHVLWIVVAAFAVVEVLLTILAERA